MVTLGIVVGSTRPGRMGSQVARWVQQRAEARPGLRAELLDLAAIALPFLDEEQYPAERAYQHQHTREWSRRVEALDAVVLVTPEYNRSFPAPLKNALDFLYEEWRRKPVGLVGYGMGSTGSRAVAALLPVVTALEMLPAGTVQVPLRERVDPAGVLRPAATDDAALDELLANVLDLTTMLRPWHAVAS
jgi:NAD(P)H-dependent FMN reductase